MVLATIHGTKVTISLVGRINKVGKYLDVKAAAAIEIFAFPFWLDDSKLWGK